MIVMAFIVFTIVTCFSFFTFTVRYNSINRAVVNVPTEIFNASIPLVNETTARFDKDVLIFKLKDYLDNHILHFVEEYSLTTYFYNKDDQSICIENNCNAIEFTVSCEISLLSKYHRTMFFEIRNK